MNRRSFFKGLVAVPAVIAIAKVLPDDRWEVDWGPYPNIQPMTASEIQERMKERMLQMGPVLERYQEDMLDVITHALYYQGVPHAERIMGLRSRL